MALRHFFANGLADPSSTKTLNQQRAKPERNYQSSEPGQHRPESLVAQNVQTRMTPMHRVQPQVEHGLPRFAASSVRRKAIEGESSQSEAGNAIAQGVRAAFISDRVFFTAGSMDSKRPPSRL